MSPKLEQDVGPPKATPERLTRAKQNVEFADDEVPVAPTRQFRKPFAARLKTSLSALLANWLTDLLSAEPLAAQRASLARALRLMALPGRKRNSQRRQVRKAHVHPFRRIHVHN
jgi:hypothetical protein